MAKLIVTIAGAVLICGSAGAWYWWSGGGEERDSAKPNNNLPALTDFTLTDSSGGEFHSSDLKGRVWVASYFFTQCGGNCRMLNMEIAKLERAYGPRGVQFVSITCDPKNDTPAELAKYADLYNADDASWTFLTGELDYLQRVGNDIFELSVTERAHHARITIVDQQGRARGTFHVLVPADLRRAKRTIETLLEDGQEGRIASG